VLCARNGPLIMFASVLIANRGEIAVRVARTAKRLGLRTIAVYSSADAQALHTRVCDEAYLIGPAAAAQSYLSADAILTVARQTNAECIHPGYGFLAENADFAEACASAGIAFIGPPPEAIRSMGFKDRAKALMTQAGVAVLPGYHGTRQDAAFLKQKAYEVGYPVLIKPVAGGGGKGMHRVDRHADFDEALETAQREGQAAFGDARVLVEKFVSAPRHIELQIFADQAGNAIHLNERDCSLQRRHQKVIEETPAPGMTAELRKTMGSAALEAARAVGYVGAGTVEFIADASKGLAAGAFWFLEMNTRLQVEHPVTEMVTGLDLVEWQFRIAAGEPLPLRQEQVPLKGHALEARLYAEDPERGFLPSTGKVLAFDPPGGEGIRVDAGVATGGEVTPYYDPMIAKVIASAPTRTEALERLADALDQVRVIGPRTNAPFLAALLRTRGFRTGKFDTGFIDNNLATLVPPREPDLAAAAAGFGRLLEHERERIAADATNDGLPPSPWDAVDGFQLSGTRVVARRVLVDDAVMTAEIAYPAGSPVVSVAGKSAALDAALIEHDDAVFVLRNGRQTVIRAVPPAIYDAEGAEGGAITAPMHGKLLALLVEKGDTVRKGQRVAILEAMKMEHALVAPFDGVVTDVLARPGNQVAERATVLVIAPSS
jgi:3-methylcrotonyl-CoA carboxylase alpha subunit